MTHITNGVVYTPPILADLAVKKLNEIADIVGCTDKRYYDPCCGDGALMDAVFRADPSAIVFGSDLSAEAVDQVRSKRMFARQADLFDDERETDVEKWIINPPYVGCSNLRRVMGDARFKWLKSEYKTPKAGACDLAGYVMRHILQKNRPAISSWIVTNTISQGSTRRVGLKWAVDAGYQIASVVKNIPWPSGAAVTVHIIVLLDTVRYYKLPEVHYARHVD